MKAKLIQSETMYTVEYDNNKDKWYTVMCIEDITSDHQYIDSTVYDDDGNEIEDEQLIARIVGAVEEIRD